MNNVNNVVYLYWWLKYGWGQIFNMRVCINNVGYLYWWLKYGLGEWWSPILVSIYEF